MTGPKRATTPPEAGDERCPKHPRANVTMFDPTGGDPFFGGPVWVPICARCGQEAQ